MNSMNYFEKPKTDLEFVSTKTLCEELLSRSEEGVILLKGLPKNDKFLHLVSTPGMKYNLDLIDIARIYLHEG